MQLLRISKTDSFIKNPQNTFIVKNPVHRKFPKKQSFIKNQYFTFPKFPEHIIKTSKISFNPKTIDQQIQNTIPKHLSKQILTTHRFETEKYFHHPTLPEPSSTNNQCIVELNISQSNLHPTNKTQNLALHA